MDKKIIHKAVINQSKIERDSIIDGLKRQLLVFEDQSGMASNGRWNDDYWKGYREALRNEINTLMRGKE